MHQKVSSDSSFLSDFGYSKTWADRFDQLTSNLSEPLEPARVVFESRELYRVMTAAGERDARLAGRLRRGDDLPAVGDWVAVEIAGDGPCRIQAIVPRITRLSRKVAGDQTREQLVAANIDTVFLVMGLDGDFNLRRLERFAVMAEESGAAPVVVLTKSDLHADAAGARLDAQASAPGLPIYVVSSLFDQGLDPLRVFLAGGETVAMVGSSGAGKSTLLNRLNGAEVMRTGAVREGDDRGRHTTTHRQLVRLSSGGLLVDNPGVREIQLWAEDSALAAAFEDIEGFAVGCRFSDCRHLDEPGCRVLEAAETGELDSGRLENWREMERELQHLERRRDVAAMRRQDKQMGRLYKRVQAEKKNRFH